MQYIPKPDRSNLLTFLRSTILQQFVIPVYQRNYAWTTNKEVNQYLNDIKAVIDQDFETHFLGIIIYLMNPVDHVGTVEFSVIDGQQRLTTTFLILYAVRDILISQGKVEEATTFEATTLNIPNRTGSKRYRLKPLVADDSVYQQIVSGKLSEVTETNSNVYKNFIYIKDTLSKWLENGITIEQILSSLDKLYIVNIPIGGNDNAQKIFESINSTGAKLTASDLIRNYMLMELDSDQQDHLYMNYWKKIEDNVTSDAKKLEAFFRFYLASKTYNLSNKSAVYREFKKWFTHQKEIKESEIEDIFTNIVNFSVYFNNLYYRTHSDEDKLSISIKEFRKNISDMPAPFLMGIYEIYETNDEFGNRLLSADQFAEIIVLLNNYLIRRSLSGLDTSDITRLFPKLLKDTINDCNGDYSNILEYVKRNLINKNRGKSSKMPDDETLRNHLQNSNAYNIKSTLRIVFEKLENKDNSAPVDQKKLSVEHILPQSPTEYWLRATELITKEEYEKYLNKIGNLTLASKKDNSKMQNNVWEYKKQILASTSHLVMNQNVLQNESWTKTEIDERTEQLINEIVKLYPYTSASDDVIIKHEIYLESNGVVAYGFLYEEDGSVEILEGSTISLSPESHSYERVENIYSDLVESGDIVEDKDIAVFKKSFELLPSSYNDTSLSIAASLLLRSSGNNGWTLWKDSHGNPLNDNKELKKKLTQRK